MKKTIDQRLRLLDQNYIGLPEGSRKTDSGSKIEDHEIFHALNAEFSQSKSFLIDSGSSNVMLSSKESFSSLDLTSGPSIYMGDDSQIPVVRKGSIKFEHGVFNNVLYVPSLAVKLLYMFIR